MRAVDAAEIKVPDDCTPLIHQVAGHFHGKCKRKLGLLEKNNKYRTVLKPVEATNNGHRELSFYEKVFSDQSDDCLAIRRIIPTFCGIDHFNDIKYLRLENLCVPFLPHPNILDAKMGRRTWDPSADEVKISRQRSKYPDSEKTGYHIVDREADKGFQKYHPSKDMFELHRKVCCRQIDGANLIHALAYFMGFSPDDHEKHVSYGRVKVRNMIDQLNELRSYLAKQRMFLFYAVSLLLFHSGDRLDGNGNNGLQASVKLVDFVHVHSNDQRDCIDENIIYGVDNVISTLEQICKDSYKICRVHRFDCCYLENHGQIVDCLFRSCDNCMKH